MPIYLTDQDIGVIRIAYLVAHLRYEINRVTDDEFEESDDDAEDEEDIYGPWFDRESLATPILLEGLTSAAENGDANAHYALALIYDPSDDPYDEPSAGGDYWYNEERNGRVLTGVEKEWADDYAAMLTRSEKYEHHLRQLARLIMKPPCSKWRNVLVTRPSSNDRPTFPRTSTRPMPPTSPKISVGARMPGVGERSLHSKATPKPCAN